jgi:uncharacterized protein YndB with AHSA1/START domain
VKKAQSTPRTINRTLSINATPDRVWSVLTRNEEIPAWFSDGASFEPKVGGKIEWRWATGDKAPYTSQATVAEWTPGQKLVVKAAEKSCWPHTTLSFSIKAEGSQTVLSLTHDGFAADYDTTECVQHWGQKLEALRYYAETGRVLPVSWTPEQIRERNAAAKVSTLFGTFDYVGKKHGEKAVEELRGSLAKTQAAYYKNLGLQSPLHFANLLAQEITNLYGDRVEVWGNANKAILERRSSAVLESACALGYTNDRGAFLKTCSEYCLALVREVGYHGESTVGPDGYRIVLTK